MKRFLLFVFAALSSFGIAADPNAVIKSALPLEGAIEAGSLAVVSQYLPGYGLQINAFTYEDSTEDELNRETLVGLVTGLAGTINGLDPNDWVSVGLTRNTFSDKRTLILVRVKPTKEESLEVFVNGNKQ